MQWEERDIGGVCGRMQWEERDIEVGCGRTRMD